MKMQTIVERLSEEGLETINDAARMVFTGRRRISPATLHRWAEHGLCDVQLESIKLGGRRYTSKAAMLRFLNAVEAKRRADLGMPAVAVVSPVTADALIASA